MFQDQRSKLAPADFAGLKPLLSAWKPCGLAVHPNPGLPFSVWMAVSTHESPVRLRVPFDPSCVQFSFYRASILK